MNRTIQDLKPNHDVSAAEAISYSYNYAVSKPDIGATEKEHIVGLCEVVKAQSERAAHAEEAFSRESDRAARMVRQRDELAAHVKRFKKEAETIRGYRMAHPWRCLEIMLAAAEGSPAVSLAAHDASLIRRVSEDVTSGFDSDDMLTAEYVNDLLNDWAKAREGAKS